MILLYFIIDWDKLRNQIIQPALELECLLVRNVDVTCNDCSDASCAVQTAPLKGRDADILARQIELSRIIIQKKKKIKPHGFSVGKYRLGICVKEARNGLGCIVPGDREVFSDQPQLRQRKLFFFD